MNDILGRRVDPATGHQIHVDDVDHLLISNNTSADQSSVVNNDSEHTTGSVLMRLKDRNDPNLLTSKVEQTIANYNKHIPDMLGWFQENYGNVRNINVDVQMVDISKNLAESILWSLGKQMRDVQSAIMEANEEEAHLRSALLHPVQLAEHMQIADSTLQSIQQPENYDQDDSVLSTNDSAIPIKPATPAIHRDFGDSNEANSLSERKSKKTLAVPSPRGRVKSGSSRPGTRNRDSRPNSRKATSASSTSSSQASNSGTATGLPLPDSDTIKCEANNIKQRASGNNRQRIRNSSSHTNKESGAALASGVLLPKHFIELDIETKLAKGLVPLWDVMERCYVSDVKKLLRSLRHCRQNSADALLALEREIIAFLTRPDAAQEVVNNWQQAFNTIPDKLRSEDICKAELYQRVEELQDMLYTMCDERKNEAEELLKQRAGNLMTDDQCNLALNSFIGLMQAELDRYAQTQQLLADTYAHLEGKLSEDLQVVHAILPLIDMRHKPNERTSARQKKGKHPIADVIPQPGGGVPLQLRQSNDSAGDAIALITAASMALENIPNRTSPAVIRAEKEQQQLEEAKRQEEEAAAAAKKKGKKSKKPFEVEVPQQTEPTEEELAMKQHQVEMQVKIAAAQDEHYAAASLEDHRLWARLRLIVSVATHMLKQLREPASQCLSRLDAAIGERYHREHSSVDLLCCQARSAIEAEVKIYRELLFSGTTPCTILAVYNYDVQKHHEYQVCYIYILHLFHVDCTCTPKIKVLSSHTWV